MSLRFFVGFSIVLATVACQPSEIELPTPEPRLVVYAYWQDGQDMTATVFRSSGPQEEVTDEIKGATVLVLEDGQLLDTLAHTGEDSHYAASRQPQPGLVYQLVVQAPGFEEVRSAPTLMPTMPTIASVATRDSTIIDGDTKRRVFSQFEATFEEPITDGLFFTVSAQMLDVENVQLYWLSPNFYCGTDTGTSYSYNGEHGGDLSCLAPLSSISYETTNEDRDAQVDSRQGITLCRINEMHHQFYIGVQDIDDDGLLTAPIQLPTNIEEGYGLFSLRTCRYFIISY